MCAEGVLQNQTANLSAASPDELVAELAKRVSKRVDDILKGGADADPIRLGMPGHRARLYELRFEATAGMLLLHRFGPRSAGLRPLQVCRRCI